MDPRRIGCPPSPVKERAGFTKLLILMSSLDMYVHIISYLVFFKSYIWRDLSSFLGSEVIQHFKAFYFWCHVSNVQPRSVLFVEDHYIDISKRYITRLFTTAIKTWFLTFTKKIYNFFHQNRAKIDTIKQVRVKHKVIGLLSSDSCVSRLYQRETGRSARTAHYNV